MYSNIIVILLSIFQVANLSKPMQTLQNVLIKLLRSSTISCNPVLNLTPNFSGAGGT